jgi:hypothetical protein
MSAIRSVPVPNCFITIDDMAIVDGSKKPRRVLNSFVDVNASSAPLSAPHMKELR